MGIYESHIFEHYSSNQSPLYGFGANERLGQCLQSEEREVNNSVPLSAITNVYPSQ